MSTAWITRKSSLVVFVVILSTALLIGALLAFKNRGPRWEADTSLVVLPSEDLRPVAMTNYYEELNVGQVVKTYAAVLRLQSVKRAAAEQLGLPRARAEQVEITVNVSPGTAVLGLTTVSPQRRDAEAMAAQVIEQGQGFVHDSFRRFTYEVISDSPQRARPVPWWRSIPWDRWIEGNLQ